MNQSYAPDGLWTLELYGGPCDGAEAYESTARYPHFPPKTYVTRWMGHMVAYEMAYVRTGDKTFVYTVKETAK